MSSDENYSEDDFEDDFEDLMEIDDNTHGWCSDCHKEVRIVESDKSMYREI